MEARLFVCVLICAFACCVYGQVGSICRPNERLLPCGCPKTCRDPAPDCKAVCKMGCFCEEGEVRNDTGHCVKLADCPPLLSAIKLDTTEPRHEDCKKNEEYRVCEPCLRTCDNPNPICPAQCSRGCFCKRDLLRDKDGSCVPFHECSNFLEYIKEKEKKYIEPIPYRFSCGKNQVYKECEKCTRTCSDPEPVCGKCKTGCFCKDGFVKGPDSKCVKLEECPKAEMSFTRSSSVEDCSSGEEYLSCGWCEPTCREPNPRCPAGCIRGCLCRPPLLRHSSGACVTEDKCELKKCPENEDYVCRYGCEKRCDGRVCLSRPRWCVLGCHCKLGLLRDSVGYCVNESQCNRTKNIV